MARVGSSDFIRLFPECHIVAGHDSMAKYNRIAARKPFRQICKTLAMIRLRHSECAETWPGYLAESVRNLCFDNCDISRSSLTSAVTGLGAESFPTESTAAYQSESDASDSSD